MGKCFKHIMLLFCGISVLQQIHAQCPANIGFENGDFSNWVCSAGKIDGTGNITLATGAPITGRHTILKNSFPQAKDPYGNFPVNCPNGSGYSIQLGNSSTGAQAEQVSYEFKIPTGQDVFSIIYNYAVVFQNPNHASYEQPKFTANVFDVTAGQYIDCPSFSFVASGNLPGFQQSTNGSTVFYKTWSPVTIKLVGYAGKTIRLEFTTNDCTKGGHFGYAYIDVNQNCASPITGNVYCNGASSLTLTAPFGFQDYHWYDSTFTNLLGTTNVLKLTPPPPPGTKIALEIVPYLGYGCLDTVYTTIQFSPDAFNMVIKDSASSCANSGADITKPIISNGSTPGLTFSYFNDPLGLDYLPTPKNVTVGGTYYIKGENAAGCTEIKPISVFINPSPGIALANNSTAVICRPNKFDLTAASLLTGGGPLYNYSYWKDAGISINQSSPNIIDTSGTYYIKAADNYGCYTVLPVSVIIDNPPVFSTKNVTACGSTDITKPTLITAAGAYKYSYWTDAATTTTLSMATKVQTSGTYYIKANTVNGCSAIQPIIVKVNANPVINAVSPAPVTYPLTVDIHSTFTNNNFLQYSYWKNAATTIPVTNPFTIDSTATYYIKAVDTLGCTVIDTIHITIKEPTITPPNAFSPNGDGINDTWQIQYLHTRFPQCIVDIFNRYGQLVLHSTGYTKPWDGKHNGQALPFGTYYYVIKINNQTTPIGGSISILP